MEFNKEYTRIILEENFNNYADPDIIFEEWLRNELEDCPESFNCFFEASWDELKESEREERKNLILSSLE